MLDSLNVIKMEILLKKPAALILSGGPNSVYKSDAPKFDTRILSLDIPIMGICYGLQLLAHKDGGRISSSGDGEYGFATINIDKKSDLKNKFELIKQDITTKGFSNAALIHGISDSSNNGGKLGWIKLSSLNSKIKNQITRIDVGKFSNPIVVPGGFLILKIEDQREVKKNLDFNKEIQLTVNEKTNEQLNKLSIVYFNKIKKDIEINAF